MILDILACLALYLFFGMIYNNTETAIDASQANSEEDSESLDDWEPGSEGGITLQCSTPSPPPTLLPLEETPETIIQLAVIPNNYQQSSEAYQALIDLDEQNWWHSSYRIVRHPFPSVQKGQCSNSPNTLTALPTIRQQLPSTQIQLSQLKDTDQTHLTPLSFTRQETT